MNLPYEHMIIQLLLHHFCIEAVLVGARHAVPYSIIRFRQRGTLAIRGWFGTFIGGLRAAARDRQ